MANPQYEHVLETALRMAVEDNSEYDCRNELVKKYVYENYIEKAKKKLDIG